MNSSTQRTFDHVFQHPITHNLEWRELRAMFEDIGDVEQEHNGNLKVTISGHAVVFQSPSQTDIATVEQVNQIRHLLRESGSRKSQSNDLHLLVVIDHQEAKVYRTEVAGSVPERIVPLNHEGHKTHIHSAHVYATKSGPPNIEAYFEAVAKSVAEADMILLFGAGVGTSSAMDLFVTWLGQHRPKIFDRVIGTVVIDETHLSEGEVLAKAREIYARQD